MGNCPCDWLPSCILTVRFYCWGHHVFMSQNMEKSSSSSTGSFIPSGLHSCTCRYSTCYTKRKVIINLSQLWTPRVTIMTYLQDVPADRLVTQMLWELPSFFKNLELRSTAQDGIHILYRQWDLKLEANRSLAHYYYSAKWNSNKMTPNDLSSYP